MFTIDDIQRMFQCLNHDDFRVIPHIVCKDGFKFSVQASWGHYCFPQTSIVPDFGYVEFEVGFPSEHEPLLGEERDDVYGYIKKETVDLILQKHGGASHLSSRDDDIIAITRDVVLSLENCNVSWTPGDWLSPKDEDWLTR